jgi:hypothetical protein
MNIYMSDTQKILSLLTPMQRQVLIDALDQYVANEGEHVEDEKSEGRATPFQVGRLAAAEELAEALNDFAGEVAV